MNRVRQVAFGLMLIIVMTQTATGRGWDLPERLTSERKIVLHPAPASANLSSYVVTLASPADRDVRALGGSGGPMWVLEVKRKDGKLVTRDFIQAIHIRVQDRGTRTPLFSVWTKTGVNYPVYCRYAYVDRIQGYCAVFCEDYEVTETETRRTQAPRREYDCTSRIP